MNKELLPEQKLLRVAGWVLLFIFAWPIWLLSMYVNSDRYEQAAYDGFSDSVIIILALVAWVAWFSFLVWIVLHGMVIG